MSAQSAGDLIGHMHDAATQACLYVDGLADEDFLADKRTQQAVILNLIVLGEAATKLMDRYPAIVEANPDIPWKSMRGMRTGSRMDITISTLLLCGRRFRRHCPS